MELEKLFHAFAQKLLQVLPLSPFKDFIGQLGSLPYLGWLNWCSELLKKAVAAGLYADLRRMGHLATCLVREHNYEMYYQSRNNTGVAQDFDKFNDFLAFTGDKDIKPL